MKRIAKFIHRGKKIFAIILLTFLMLISLTAKMSWASAPSIEWQKTLGGIGGDKPNVVLQTNDGGYVVAGFLSVERRGFFRIGSSAV